MNKFIKVTPLRLDVYQEYAKAYGCRAYEFIDDLEPEMVEDVLIKMQGRCPAGSAPGRAEVADSMIALVQAGLVRVV